MGRHSAPRRRRAVPVAAAGAVAALGVTGAGAFIAADSLRSGAAPAASSTGSATSSPTRASGDVAVQPAGAVDPSTTPAAATASPTTATGPGCPTGPTVTVTTTPEMAPAVTRLAADVERRGGTGCVRYQVSAVPAGLVADRVTEGQAPPQVWVPDSPLWLERIPAARRGSATFGQVVATSPVALAVPQKLVDGGLRTGTYRWDDLVSGPRVPMAMADPEYSTPSMLTLVSGLRAARTAQDAQTVKGSLSQLAQTARPETELMTLAAQGSAQAAVFPASEQQIAAERKASPDHPVSAIQLGDGLPSLEYGVVAFPSGAKDTTTAAAADRLRAEMAGPNGQAVLASLGFRGAQPSGGPSPTGTTAVPGMQPTAAAAPTPSAKESQTALAAWAAVRRTMRMIVGIDVSGSMLQKIDPKTRRIDLTMQSAQRALAVLPDTTEMGVWVFSDKRGPNGSPFLQVAPIRPLGQRLGTGTQRSFLAHMAIGFPRLPRGGTALYDTISAAVDAVRADYDPTKVNSVVLWTDGVNRDAGTMTKQELLAQLRYVSASDKPVRVVLVGMGNDSDLAVMREIAAASGGVAYNAYDPKQIDSVIAAAVTSRMDLGTAR